MRLENLNAYPSKFRRKVLVTAECIIDGVPGSFNQIEDHLRWMCSLPYIAAVEVAPTPGRERSARLIIATLYLRVRAARRLVRTAASQPALNNARAAELEAWNALQSALQVVRATTVA